MFTATKWNMAEDKEKFAAQFVKFVESDFAASKFPKWFYERLSNTFGHAAMYNRDGFYNYCFTDTGRKVQFLEGIMDYPCYGKPDYTYSDVEAYLQEWLREHAVLEAYRQKLAAERDAFERAEYLRLKAKFEGANA